MRSWVVGTGLTNPTTAAALTSGATEGDPTSVLTGLEGDRNHLIVFHSDDSTAFGKVKAHQAAMSAEQVQKWGLCLAAFVGTQGNCQTLANAMDSYRAQVCWLENCDFPIFELAADFAGARAIKAANESLDGFELRHVTAQYDETAWPTPADLELSLEEGITPLEPHRDSGRVTIVRSVTTRQTAPVAFLDHMTIEISDYTDETIIQLFQLRAKGKRLKAASPPGRPRRQAATPLAGRCAQPSSKPCKRWVWTTRPRPIR
jgi:phage tail sheath gpL-like